MIRSHPNRRRRARAVYASGRRTVAGVGPAHSPPAGVAGDAGAHDELVSLARSIRAAAVAEDVAALSRSVHQLRWRLRRHIEAERRRQSALAPALRAVVFGGQDRLMRLVDAVSRGGEGERAAACLQRATEIVVAVHRQLALEAAALLRPSDAR